MNLKTTLPRAFITVLIALFAPLSFADAGLGVLIRPVKIVEGHGTGTRAVFKVRVDHAPSRPFTCAYRTVSGTAVSGLDYVPISGELTFSSATMTAALEVEIIGDTAMEGDEAFSLWIQTAGTVPEHDSYGACVIENDDWTAGVAHHFVVEAATAQHVGKPFTARVTAVDFLGNLVTDYDGRVTIHGTAVAEPTSPILLSAVDPGQIDGITLVNVSTEPVDIAGWSIDFFDNERYPQACLTYVIDSGVLDPGEVATLWEWTGPSGMVGAMRMSFQLRWYDTSTFQRAAVAVRDPSGKLMDSFFTGLADPHQVHSREGDLAFSWAGRYFNSAALTTFQRVGRADSNTSNDWVIENRSGPEPHAALILPFASAARIPLTSAVVTLRAGVWEGTLTIPNDRFDALFVRVEDGNGHAGASQPVAVSLENDLSVQVVAPAKLDRGQPYNVSVVISNSGPATYSNVVLSNRTASGVEFTAVETPGTFTTNNGALIVTLPSIAPGATTALTLRSDSLTPGRLTNIASILIPETDAKTNNNSATATTDSLPECSPLPGGLIAWWRGENTFTDAVGARTLQTGAVPVTFGEGKVGAGFNFKQALELRLEGTNATSLNVQEHEDFTIALWARFPKPTYHRPAPGITLVGKSEGTGSSARGYRLFAIGEDDIEFAFRSQYSVEGWSAVAAGALNLDHSQMHHIAVTLSRRDGDEAVLYVNGVERARSFSRGHSGSPIQTSGPFVVGGPLVEQLDELEIYKRALAPSEIAASYASGGAGRCGEDVTVSIETSSQAAVGEESEVTIRAFNIATASPRTFHLVYSAPSGVSFVSSSIPDTVHTEDGRVLLTDQTLPPGESLVWKIRVRPLISGVSSHTASIIADSSDYAGNNSAAAPLFTLDDCLDSGSRLLGWWRAEGNGTDSVNGQNADISNASFAPGWVGQAFSFDGISNKVHVPNNSSISQIDRAFTIDAWIQTIPGRTPQYESIVDKRIIDPTATRATGFALILTRDGILFQMGDADQSHVPGIWGANPKTLRDGQFHHIAVTIDRDADIGRIYFDGALLHQFPVNAEAGHLSITNNSPLHIGSSAQGSPSFPFAGLIDEVGIYGESLTPAQIAELQRIGKVGRCASGVNLDITAPAAGGGEAFPVRYELHNWRATTLSNASVTVTLPVGASIVSYSAGPNAPPTMASNTVPIAPLAPGDTASFTVFVRSALPGVLAWTASAAADGSVVSSDFEETIIFPLCAKEEALVMRLPFDGSLIEVANVAFAGLERHQFGPGLRAGSAVQLHNASAPIIFRPSNATVNAAQSFSVETWIRIREGSPQRMVLMQQSAQDETVWLQINNGEVVASVADVVMANSPQVRGGVDLRDGVPHHIALTMEWSPSPSRYAATLYVDGVPKGTFYRQNSLGNLGVFRLGNDEAGSAPFIGELDEFVVYRRALPPVEIQARAERILGHCNPEVGFAGAGSKASFVGRRAETALAVFSSGSPATNIVVRLIIPTTVGSMTWNTRVGTVIHTANGLDWRIDKLEADSTAELFWEGVTRAEGQHEWSASLAFEGADSDVANNQLSSAFTAIDPCAQLNAATFWLDGSSDRLDRVLGLTPILTTAAVRIDSTNSSLTLNGAGQGLSYATHTNLNFAAGDAFSFEAWIKASGTKFYLSILDKRNFSPLKGYSLFLAQGIPSIYLADADGPDLYVSATSPDLRDSKFHHIAVSVDRAATNGITFWVDGKMAGVFDARTIGDLVTSAEMRVGYGVTDTYDSWFLGEMDEVVIHKRLLTQNDIDAVVAAGVRSRCESDPANADKDLDGMRDEWERAHGLSDQDAADANIDTDFDGASNVLEYRTGTDPNSASSVFAVAVETTSNAGAVILTVPTVPGNTYTVQGRDDLQEDSWSNISPPSVAPGATTSFQVMPEAQQQFIRIQMEE